MSWKLEDFYFNFFNLLYETIFFFFTFYVFMYVVLPKNLRNLWSKGRKTLKENLKKNSAWWDLAGSFDL